MLALLVQLFIAAFSSFLVVGLVSLYDPASISGGALAVGVSGDAADDLDTVIDQDERWSAVEYDTRDAAMTAFSQGRIDAVFHTTRRSSGRVGVEAIVPDGSLRTTLIVVQVREILSVYERQKRTAVESRLTNEPVPPIDAPDGSPYFEFTYTVLLPLLMFLPAFISGSIAADAIVEEFDRGTMDVLRSAPLSLAAIVDGKLLATVSLAPIQASVWLVLLDFNGTPVSHPVPIVLLVTAVTVVVAAFGAALSLALKDRRAVQFLYSMGMVILFTGTYLLPENPANAIARLAVGHPSPLSYGLVVGFGVAAVGAYGLLREVIDRSVP